MSEVIPLIPRKNIDMADDADGANPDDADVFVYTTGSIIPDEVVRARVHPSITVIPQKAFMYCRKLEEVELSEGLLEIGVEAFHDCIGLKRITIPSTVTLCGVISWRRLSYVKGSKQSEMVHSIIAEL